MLSEKYIKTVLLIMGILILATLIYYGVDPDQDYLNLND